MSDIPNDEKMVWDRDVPRGGVMLEEREVWGIALCSTGAFSVGLGLPVANTLNTAQVVIGAFFCLYGVIMNHKEQNRAYYKGRADAFKQGEK